MQRFHLDCKQADVNVCRNNDAKGSRNWQETGSDDAQREKNSQQSVQEPSGKGMSKLTLEKQKRIPGFDGEGLKWRTKWGMTMETVVASVKRAASVVWKEARRM